MNTTAQITPSRTPSALKQPTDPRRDARGPASKRPAFGEMLAEIDPLIGFVPFYGPPVGFVVVPWLVLCLMLAPPFACLFALVVVMVVAAAVLAGLIGAVLAIVAAPYALVGRLRRHRERQASIAARAGQVVAIQSPRVAA